MSKLRAATITLTVATTMDEEQLRAALEAAESVTLQREGRFFVSEVMAADLMDPKP